MQNYTLKHKDKILQQGTLKECIRKLLELEDNIYHASAYKGYEIQLDGVKQDIDYEIKLKIEQEYKKEEYIKLCKRVSEIIKHLGLNIIEKDSQKGNNGYYYPDSVRISAGNETATICFRTAYNSNGKIEVSPIFKRDIKQNYITPYEYNELSHSIKMNPFKSLKLIKTQFESKYLPEHNRLMAKNAEQVKNANAYLNKTSDSEKAVLGLRDCEHVSNVRVSGDSVYLELYSMTVEQAKKVVEVLN